jgi:hypothetical protein
VESKSPPVDSSWEFHALRSRFLRVLSHMSEEGDTLEIDVSSLSTLTHIATYIREESPLLVLQLCSKFTFCLNTYFWFKVDLELSKLITTTIL